MNKSQYLLIIFCCFALSSCKVFFPNYLFRDNKDFSYTEFIDSLNQQETVISEGDLITFRMYTRDGYHLIDFVSGVGGKTSSGSNVKFIVKNDGYVELPIAGVIYVKGLTKFELADLLEEKYASLYNNPFILLEVTNRRVFVFMGLDGASVISLPNENTTLLEIIALAGGISSKSKSSKIKLIRGDYENPIIKKIDLSTIDGLKDANIIMQPNDVVIVAPITRLAPAILKEITPFLALFTTVFTLIILLKGN